MRDRIEFLLIVLAILGMFVWTLFSVAFVIEATHFEGFRCFQFQR
jgi:hypothetical protein